MINIKSYSSLKSNAKGKQMEKLIEAACDVYRRKGVAHIVKVPEPFMVLSINKDRKSFVGKFMDNAEPDFLGSDKNGHVVAFESKYTATDKIKQSVISDRQKESLDLYHQLKAHVGVCVGIKTTYAFIPWTVWTEMKTIYGRKYMTEDEIKEYEVWTPGYIDFLKAVERIEQNE